MTAGTEIRIPTLETERLVLRAPGAGDFPAFAGFMASERSRMVGGPMDEGPAWIRYAGLIGHWHLRGYGRWMVTDAGSGAPLGIVGPMYPPDWPEPEIAWSLFDAAEGRGIAAEAALAARAYVYDTLGWRRVVSCMEVANTRSRALARRLGAVHERNFRHPVFGEMEIWRHPAPGGRA